MCLSSWRCRLYFCVCILVLLMRTCVGSLRIFSILGVVYLLAFYTRLLFPLGLVRPVGTLWNRRAVHIFSCPIYSRLPSFRFHGPGILSVHVLLVWTDCRRHCLGCLGRLLLIGGNLLVLLDQSWLGQIWLVFLGGWRGTFLFSLLGCLGASLDPLLSLGFYLKNVLIFCFLYFF